MTATIKALFAIATSSEPMTAKEVADVLDVDHGVASSALCRLHRKDVVDRSRRPVLHKEGRHPYEYSLSSWEVVFG